MTNIELIEFTEETLAFEEPSTKLDDAKLKELGLEEFLRQLHLYNKGKANSLGTHFELPINFGDARAIRDWWSKSVFNRMMDTSTGGIKNGWSLSIIPIY